MTHSMLTQISTAQEITIYLQSLQRAISLQTSRIGARFKNRIKESRRANPLLVDTHL